jgi:hypothetical protein
MKYRLGLLKIIAQFVKMKLDGAMIAADWKVSEFICHAVPLFSVVRNYAAFKERVFNSPVTWLQRLFEDKAPFYCYFEQFKIFDSAHLDRSIKDVFLLYLMQDFIVRHTIFCQNNESAIFYAGLLLYGLLQRGEAHPGPVNSEIKNIIERVLFHEQPHKFLLKTIVQVNIAGIIARDAEFQEQFGLLFLAKIPKFLAQKYIEIFVVESDGKIDWNCNFWVPGVRNFAALQTILKAVLSTIKEYYANSSCRSDLLADARHSLFALIEANVKQFILENDANLPGPSQDPNIVRRLVI